MDRRKFLGAGAAVSAGFAVAGPMGLLSWSPRAHAANLSVSLAARRGNVAMIDGTNAFMFSFSHTSGMSFPGTTLVCQEGDSITINLSNTLNTRVALKIGGTNIRETVSARSSRAFTFTAPAAGSYLYYDDQNNGVNRIMGLHGALVVMPSGIKNRSFSNGPAFVRQYKWLLGNVDPAWGEIVRTQGDNAVTQINPDSFQPRYFTINGNAYDNTHEYNTEIMGHYNEAALVRLLNAGGMVHSPHFHGNHVEIVSVNHQHFASNRKKKDVVSMFPLDVRDVIVPFSPPPDAWPPVSANRIQHFPMHCHAEMSQTAGGGLYPHGMHAPMVMGMAPPSESDLNQSVANLP
ncbi:MAG: multicopper oxidase domain-containing protein [Chromatiales bacterium]|nr:multicopper oxidase domain-containing protein [Gammaproteobacteria bacterium]MBW6476080.1 multicopper oxidase domain-containing protein [Chromatiales bacterium]